MTHSLLWAATSELAGPTWNLALDVQRMLAVHFMVNALRAGTAVAVVAAVVGWFMVMRQQSFVGHTLAVVSFPGAAVAIWIGASVTIGFFAGSLAAALVIAAARRTPIGRVRSQESALIGTVQAAALALGAIAVALYGGFLDNLTGLLFGSFLGVSDGQVIVLLVVSIGVLAAVCAVGRPLLFSSVDEAVADARGVPVRLLATGFLIVLALTAAEVSQVTGALLVFALLVMPAAAAQQMTARPGLAIVLAVVIGVLVVWLALSAAFYSTWPVGFFVATFGFAAFVVASAARRTVDRWGSSRQRASTQRASNQGAPTVVSGQGVAVVQA